MEYYMNKKVTVQSSINALNSTHNKYLMTQFAKDQEVEQIIKDLLNACTEIADVFRNNTVSKLESSNNFGDIQLQLDVEADHIIEKHLRNNSHVGGFASEERPVYTELGNGHYIITFDPLDGSSIVDTNFAIGSIFCIWKKTEQHLLGQKGSDAITSMIVTYGPRTTCIYYNDLLGAVQELTLIKGEWKVSQAACKIEQNSKIFSPGNLRSASENKDYADVIAKWIARGLTLRYTGGFVPDAHQFFIKGHGIFASVASPKYPAKLRVLYEVVPICLLIQKAGGKTIGRKMQSALDIVITGFDQRMEHIMGSSKEVDLIKHLLQ